MFWCLRIVKALTNGAFSYGVTEFDSKLESNWSTGAGEADADHEQRREKCFEGVGFFEGDELLGDERANDEN